MLGCGTVGALWQLCSQALPCMNENLQKKGGEPGTFCHVRNVTGRENLIACGQTKMWVMYYFIPVCCSSQPWVLYAWWSYHVTRSIQQSCYPCPDTQIAPAVGWDVKVAVQWPLKTGQIKHQNNSFAGNCDFLMLSVWRDCQRVATIDRRAANSQMLDELALCCISVVSLPMLNQVLSTQSKMDICLDSWSMYPNHMMFSPRMRWERGLNITCCTDLIPSLCPAFHLLTVWKSREGWEKCTFQSPAHLYLQATFTVIPAVLEMPQECIRYWIVVVSVVAGLIALLIIIALLGAVRHCL